ncbi:hypothetical protein LBMAG42_07500 [Deltaproteobacteria bacterium]|nr:hypothetical protein LBMAG42_07500 [Deltaproteobacteria bacterium]
MLLSLIGCASIECGAGTAEQAGVCRPVEAGADTGADSGTADSGDSADTADGDVGPLEVYLLAGQSNMDGYAFYPGLPPSDQVADPRVPLYWSGWGEFRDLQPASYGGAAYVGPEVTLGRSLADAGRRVVLVKHAVGGTDLANFWYPGSVPGDFTAGEGFVVLMDSVEAATEALDAAGEPWVWGGFVWMQGESDALDLSMAHAYEENLVGLLAAVREITDTPELPATIGMISTESAWTYSGIVRDAEIAVGEADPNVRIVETDDLPRNVLDVYHYDSVSNRVLGQRFASAILSGADVGPGADAPVAAFTLGAGRADYDFTGTCGWEFTTEVPIGVTDLGAYGSSYLTVSVDVGLWDAAGNLRVRANVPSWYDAPAVWRGSVWYVAIDPVVLEPGTYRLGMVSWTGDADRYLNDATGTYASGIGYSAAVYAEGYWLTYPSTSFESATMSFLGPDFLFVPG